MRRAYGRIGFPVPPRPSSHRRHRRVRSRLSRIRDGAPRLSVDLEAFRAASGFSNVWVRVSGSFRVTSPSKCIHRLSKPRPCVRGRLPAGFGPFDRSRADGLRSAATPRAPASAGFPHPLDALISVSASRAFFIPVRPWGSPLQGLYFRRIARASRPVLPFLTFSCGVRTRRPFVSKGFKPRRKPTSAVSPFRQRRTAALVGFSPLQGLSFRSPRPFGTGTSAGFSFSERSVRRAAASRGNQPEGRIGHPIRGPPEVFSPRRRCRRSALRPGLAMCSLGASSRVATEPRAPFDPFEGPGRP